MAALRLVSGQAVDPVAEAAARRTAYGIVADAMLAASKVPGLPESDHARLIRCYRLAARKVGLAPLTPVGAT